MTARSSRFVLIKNAVANVVRGSSAALVALVLPPFLVRVLSTDAFAAWSLVLQLSLYTGFLDFGIQTAVGRFVAHSEELKDHHQRDRVVSTSFVLLLGSGVVAFAAMLLLAWFLPVLFAGLPPALYADARLALLIVGGVAAIGLPASVFNGIFIGLQRNEVPAAIIAGSRIISTMLLVIAAYLSGNIVLMAVVMGVIQLGSYVIQYMASRKLANDVRLSPALLSKQTTREIFTYCFSLSIWSFATLLVTGIGTTLVGIFDFQAVAYYSVAVSLTTFILGLQNALFSTLIPAAAVLSAREHAQQLATMLISSTRFSMFILLFTGLPLIIGAESLLTLWVGSAYAKQTRLLLQLLVIANIIRLSALPYAMLLIGTGQQRLVTITPLIEGFTGLLVSVVAGALFGAVGVAFGTIVGSIVGVGCHILINMPRTTSMAVNIGQYVKDGLLRPLVCVLPFVIVAATLPLFEASGSTWSVAIGFATILTLFASWHWGLEAAEQRNVVSLLAYRLQNVSRK